MFVGVQLKRVLRRIVVFTAALFAASMLARMEYPKFPVALGVLYAEMRPTYDATLAQQRGEATQKFGKGNLSKLLNGGATWEI